MLIMSYMGDHVWLMTSRHTDPELQFRQQWLYRLIRRGWDEVVLTVHRYWGGISC